MTPVEQLLTVTGAVYLVAIVWLSVGLRRVSGDRRRRATGTREQVDPGCVSVIVAARDEERVLGNCLRALRHQEYAGELEVIVVDDRSRDRTAPIVRELAAAWPVLRLVQVTSPTLRCPKKNALATGIECSRGELLLFTDADCEPSPDWVRSTVDAFGEGVGMVTGYAAPGNGQRWIHKVLALDNLAVAAMGAGSAGMGEPLSCSGRNLAYRRCVYDEVGGFASSGHLVGGDDVYMMRSIRAQTDWMIVYNADPLAWVTSDPGSGAVGAVLQQKLRHASKAGRYSGPARLLGVSVYAFHLLTVVALCKALAGGGGAVVTVVWAARWLADWALLRHFATHFTRDGARLLRYLPYLEFAYLPYVLLAVPLGSMGLFRWRRERAVVVDPMHEQKAVV